MQLSVQDILLIWSPILGLLGIMWHHMNGNFESINEGFEKLEKKITNRIDNMRQELADKIDAVDQKFSSKLDGLDNKLDNNIEKLAEKIDTTRDRISRIEGQLIPTKKVPFDFEAFEPEKPKKRLKAQG